MAKLLFETGYGISVCFWSSFAAGGSVLGGVLALLLQIFSWAAVNCSSGLTELWPALETNWTRVLVANSFKAVSYLRFLEGLVSREAIPFLIWLKSSVFRRLRACCEEGMSSYKSQRGHFPKDLIGRSCHVPTHVFLFVPPPQREKKGFY